MLFFIQMVQVHTCIFESTLAPCLYQQNAPVFTKLTLPKMFNTNIKPYRTKSANLPLSLEHCFTAKNNTFLPESIAASSLWRRA